MDGCGLRQEVTDLRQREKLRQVQIQYYLDRLPEQEKQVWMVHPEFRLQKEMENPRFFRLVQAGVEPREAYEMVHRRELTAKAMHFAAQVAPGRRCGWWKAAGGASRKMPGAAPASAVRPGKAHKPGAGGHPETGDGRGEDQLLNLRTGTIRGMKKGENI